MSIKRNLETNDVTSLSVMEFNLISKELSTYKTEYMEPQTLTIYNSTEQ